MNDQKLTILLRPWNMADLDYLVKFANNAKIACNLTDAFPHPYSRENGIAYISTFSNDNPAKIFAITVDGIPCGSIGISPQTDIHRKNAEMGYWLAEEYWGRGIMTEAVKQTIRHGFDSFDLERIFARPFSTNIASQRVLEKAGMKLEARFEKTIIKNGIFLDELFYSVRRQGT